MAMTTAERQAKYRESRHHAGKHGDGQRRINAWVDLGTYLALERISLRYGLTKRDALEKVIRAEDERIFAGMEYNSKEWNEYMNWGTKQDEGESKDALQNEGS